MKGKNRDTAVCLNDSLRLNYETEELFVVMKRSHEGEITQAGGFIRFQVSRVKFVSWSFEDPMSKLEKKRCL